MRTKTTALAMVVAMLAAAGGVSWAQEPAAGPEQGRSDPVADERIAFVRQKMARYRLYSPGPKEVDFPLQEQLALRWSNPVSGVVDGGIFVWTRGGRPAAVGKCFLNEVQEAWGEVIHSVAAAPLVMTHEGREIWKPAAAGITFHPLAGPARPATTAAGRLTQMRTLMRHVEVIGIWGEKEPSEWSLRMLTAPVHRYQSEADGVLDGAVFAFTQGGTNPEAIGVIELLASDAGPQWQFAAARLTQYGVKAKLDGQVLAHLPRNEQPEITENFYRGWHWFRRYPFPKEGAGKEE